MSRVPLRRAAPAAFRCPACDEALRVRGTEPGRAFDCPACGRGLLLDRDDDGVVSVRPLGGTEERAGGPWWPFALAAVGVACAIAAGWLAVGGADAEPNEQPIAVAKAPAVEVPVVPPPEPVEPERFEPEPEAPAKPQAVATPPVSEPEPVVTMEPEPIRPAVTAPRPGADVAVRRTRRRLGAVLSSYSLPRPVPLRVAVEDLEDLLRQRIEAPSGGERLVQVDLPGPLTVGEALDALAAAAGLAVEIDAEGVRLVPNENPGSPSPLGGAPPE